MANANQNQNTSSVSKVIWVVGTIFLLGSLAGTVVCAKGLYDSNTNPLPVIAYDYDNTVEQDRKNLKKDYILGLVVCILVFVTSFVMLIINYSKSSGVKRVAPELPVTNANGPQNQNQTVERRGRTIVVNNTTNITTCSNWTLLCCCVRSETTN